MDALISEIKKSKSGVNVFYSTLSDYIKAVHDYSKQNQISFPTFEGDLMPLFSTRKRN